MDVESEYAQAMRCDSLLVPRFPRRVNPPQKRIPGTGIMGQSITRRAGGEWGTRRRQDKRLAWGGGRIRRRRDSRIGEEGSAVVGVEGQRWGGQREH